jgi:hypothetical protein
MNKLEKALIERYTEKKIKSNNFKYGKYLQLRQKLIDKNVELTSKREKEFNNLHDLESKKIRPNVNVRVEADIRTLLFGTGAAIGAITSAPHLCAEEPGKFVASVLGGVAAGFIAGELGAIAYADNTAAKLIHHTAIKHKIKTVRKLGDKIESNNYKLYCLRKHEREENPSYEDYITAVETQDDTLQL